MLVLCRCVSCLTLVCSDKSVGLGLYPTKSGCAVHNKNSLSEQTVPYDYSHNYALNSRSTT